METTPLLETIQKLQFTKRAEAEALLLVFIRETFPQLDVVEVELRPQVISLNSFNGFLRLANGQRLFFKTHVEQDNVIGEYYNAEMLAQAGYPVIQPLYSSTQSGQQILIYEVVTDPSVFDVARTLEDSSDHVKFAQLTQAQHDADDHLLACYRATLAPQSADEAASAPIHQLFYHRLTGGRLDRFYGEGTEIALPQGILPMSEMRQFQWTINGSIYHETLDEIIQRAITLLNPAHSSGLTIIGHGDAHNGNVFFNAQERKLTYFDPAFAGRHTPVLDLAKPLFHNVFAMWMYFPLEEREKLTINVRVEGKHCHVDHNYGLNSVREMFLQSKVERVLIPMLQTLKEMLAVPDQWRSYLKSALFCCPFLTLDLKRFPPEISLLGLTMAVQMGAESTIKRSIIDRVLDEVEAEIQ